MSTGSVWSVAPSAPSPLTIQWGPNRTEGWVCQFIKQLCPENQLERDASNSRTHSCWLRKREVHVREGCGNLFWVFLPDIRWDCPEMHPLPRISHYVPNSS